MSTPVETEKLSNESQIVDKAAGDYYFDSYSHFGIHEEMLKDKVRTRTYMNSIIQNKHLFKDKVVLDVGCGTGILCMFAAQAGAKHVIGVECAGIYHQAIEIVKANKLDHIITLVKGKLEEITLPHGLTKVDIIISEWMGYFLLYESMLDTVLYARDKWLVPNGAIFPDTANLYLCGIEDGQYKQSKLNFWDNVYGFDMSCIREMAELEPLVDFCDAKQIATNTANILHVDIYTVKKEELDFSSNFTLTATKEETIHALCAFFDCVWMKTHTCINFSTSPQNEYTHWKNTIFYLKNAIPVRPGDVLEGSISVKRNAINPRDLDIELTCGKRGAKKAAVTQPFRLR